MERWLDGDEDRPGSAEDMPRQHDSERSPSVPKNRPQDRPQDEDYLNLEKPVLTGFYKRQIKHAVVHHVLRRLIQIPHH